MSEPPAELTVVASRWRLKCRRQVLPALGVAATCMPAGKVSVTAIPFMAPVFVAGFGDGERHRRDAVYGDGGGCESLGGSTGGAVTVRVAVLEATPVPPLVEVGAPVVLL